MMIRSRGGEIGARVGFEELTSVSAAEVAEDGNDSRDGNKRENEW